MYRDTWTYCHPSICSISFSNLQGQRIGSGTGFKIGNHLVTNNHVYAAPGSAYVELRFVNDDGHTIKAVKTISYMDFQHRLQIGMPEDSWDYAILNLEDTEFNTIPSLTLANSGTIPIGKRIAVMGFQFEQSNLSIKQGILSSRYIRAGVKYMQIDASVNQGNSGGPLIDIDNNTVVGIITRKHTGLTNVFDELLKSFANNIEVLQTSTKGVGMRVGGINPIEVLITSQHQMKATAIELRRSANVGIGYAYELDEIKQFFTDPPASSQPV